MENKCSADDCADKYKDVNYYCDDCGALYCEWHAEALDFICECIIKPNIKKIGETKNDS